MKEKSVKYIINAEYNNNNNNNSFFITFQQKQKKTIYQKILPCIFKQTE
tara:strand:+ start:53 stop:199 length:147 start_codon:yes stop_codon:yes gene_type:complete